MVTRHETVVKFVTCLVILVKIRKVKETKSQAMLRTHSETDESEARPE